MYVPWVHKRLPPNCISISSADANNNLITYFTAVCIHLSIMPCILIEMQCIKLASERQWYLLLLWCHSSATYSAEKWNTLLHFSKFASFNLVINYTCILQQPRSFHWYIVWMYTFSHFCTADQHIVIARCQGRLQGGGEVDAACIQFGSGGWIPLPLGEECFHLLHSVGVVLIILRIYTTVVG